MREVLNFERLKEVILNNPAGFTMDLKGNLIKKGFACAITNRNQKTDLNENLTDLFRIIKRDFNQMGKNIFIGGWVENGVFYLDLVILEKVKAKGLYLMRVFNQKGIFWIEKNLFIPNKDYKKTYILLSKNNELNKNGGIK